MTTLACAFPDRIRFYDRVMKPESSRLFIPTDELLRAADEVDVEISLSTEPQPITVRSTVVASRTRRGSVAADESGVWVQIAPQELDRLRDMLRLRDGEGASTTTRKDRRVPVPLPALIEKPLTRTVRLVDIGCGGVCLATLLPTPVGQTIRLSVDFGDESLSVYAKLTWRRDDLCRTGAQFRFQDDATRIRVTKRVRRLLGDRMLTVAAKPSVLVVDDDLATLAAIERALQAYGYATMTAVSGPEALSMAREYQPAMILLDVLLPGMNGLEVCRLLKRDAGTSSTPVVLTSALSADELARLQEEAGALGALPKPYRLNVLNGLVEAVIDQHQTLITKAGSAVDDERRDSSRVPAFLHGRYESATLDIETWLKDISKTGAFLTSPWGDAVGTKGTLTIAAPLAEPVDITVEVARQASWGLMQDQSPESLPGIGLRFLDCAGLVDLHRWLDERDEKLRGKPVILLVDDDRSYSRVLHAALENAGFAVISLHTPQTVTSAVVAARPTLVILDYMMPGLAGTKLCKHLKSDARTRDVSVWLHTSLSEIQGRELAAQCGADGYLIKGQRPSQIIERIKEHLATASPKGPGSSGASGSTASS